MNNKTLNMKIPEELYREVQEIAKSKHISTASLVRLILSEYIENNKK